MEYQGPGDSNTEGLQVLNQCIESVWGSRPGGFSFTVHRECIAPAGSQLRKQSFEFMLKRAFLEIQATRSLAWVPSLPVACQIV